MMLIIIPLLTVSDADVSLSLAVQMINSLGYLNSTDPTTYSVRNYFILFLKFSLIIYNYLLNSKLSRVA